MAHTVGFGKTEFKVIPRGQRPLDLRIALSALRLQLQADPKKLERFWNGPEIDKHGERRRKWPDVLPRLPLNRGRTYVEFRVGRATASTDGDPNAAGTRRLVVELDGGNRIRQVYFSDNHYCSGSWRIVEY